MIPTYTEAGVCTADDAELRITKEGMYQDAVDFYRSISANAGETFDVQFQIPKREAPPCKRSRTVQIEKDIKHNGLV